METAKFLSKNDIDVIAVYEQVLDNDTGEMTEAGKPIVQKLPLINYIMPTAYQWTRVYLEADMEVEEFNTANGFKIKSKSTSAGISAGGSAGVFGFGGSFSAGLSSKSTSVSGSGETSRDKAAGSFHMEATLEPRPDLQLPKPFVIQKGPRLELTAGSRTDITEPTGSTTPATGTTVTKGRQVELIVKLLKSDNTPNAEKSLGVKVSDPLITYETTGKTDTSGEMKITLKRTGLAYDPAKAPEAVTVTVWLGLVSQQVAIPL